MTTLSNAELAARLEQYAALLELAEASPFSSRAYRRGADLVRTLAFPVADLVTTGRVRELRGIGPRIEERLRELVETGDIAELRELERTLSPEIAAAGRLFGIGARRATDIASVLGLRDIDEFRAAATSGRLREVPGIGPKTEARIRAALEQDVRTSPRPLLLPRAKALVERIAAQIGGVAAGDPRRWMDACTWLSLVAPEGHDFEKLPEIVTMIARNVGITIEGAPVEFFVATPEAWGTALVRATGSVEWVAALEPLPEASSEEGVFAALGLPFVPPELREDRRSPNAVDLVSVSDIRGDLHCHTTWSDGKASVLEMGTAARDRGYEYLAICDHTPNVTVVPGLDADALRRQADEIAAANEQLFPFRILRGAECDIRADGSLDLPDDVLSELEWVQLSLHAGQRAPRAQLTARVCDAMRHPAVRCLSHPTGRLIGHRPENALDLERTIEVALETDVALEVNGLPSRLDLKGEHVRTAVDAGVRVVCSTDAHSIRGLGNIDLSVHTARRGGARAGDVVNTMPLVELAR
jgi:DNA polymerase (family 10)